MFHQTTLNPLNVHGPGDIIPHGSMLSYQAQPADITHIISGTHDPANSFSALGIAHDGPNTTIANSVDSPNWLMFGALDRVCDTIFPSQQYSYLPWCIAGLGGVTALITGVAYTKKAKDYRNLQAMSNVG